MKRAGDEIGDNWSEHELEAGNEGKAPFLKDIFKMSAREHVANTNKAERGGCASDVANGALDWSWKIDSSEEEDGAENNGDDIWV